MRSIPLVCILAMGALSVLSGCTPIEGRTMLLQPEAVAPPIAPDRVRIITDQSESDRFEHVARLQYRTPGDNFDGAAERVLLERLRREAAALGADALLEVTFTVEEDGTETLVNEYRYGDLSPNDRHRRWGTETTTARVRTVQSYRTTVTAIAARRR